MIGSFGIAKFADARKFVMGFNTLVAIMITLLCIASMAGWSTDQNTLKNSAWAKSSNSGQDIYVGLQGFYSTLLNKFYMYSDCSSTSNSCDLCQKGGSAALGLYLISFFILIGVTVGTVIRMFKDTLALKISMLILSFIVWVFTVAGFGNWNEKCYKTLGDIPGTGSSLSYGAGYGVAVCTWFFSTLIFILHLLTPVTESGGQEATTTGDFTKA